MHEPQAPQSRLIMPLFSPRVLPHQPTRIAGWTSEAFAIKGLNITHAGTPGGADDWIVNDIEVAGRSQLTHKDLPGALFGSGGVAAARRASTKLAFNDFDPVERNRELTIIVTYVGSNPEGTQFRAAFMGSEPPQRPTVIPIVSAIGILPTTRATISACVLNAPFQMERLEILDSNNQLAGADWRVEDLRVNGRSQFARPDYIPGALFAASELSTLIKGEACETMSAIEIDVSYIGSCENGAPFVARLEGTVIRNDYNVAPPDLRVLVATSGKGPGRVVVATCDWRSPPSKEKSVDLEMVAVCGRV